MRSDPRGAKGRAKKLELFDGRALDSETAADERPPELASEALKGEIVDTTAETDVTSLISLRTFRRSFRLGLFARFAALMHPRRA